MTQFEAAMRVEAQMHPDEIGTSPVLIIDVDLLEAGVYKMENGNPVLICKTEAVPEWEELKEKAFGVKQYGLEKIWKGQIELVNAKLERYYRSNQLMDCTVISRPELQREFSCSDLVEMFSKVKQRLEVTFEKLSTEMETQKIEENDIKILLIGEYAKYVLFLYAAKEYFSFDAFMADSRFLSSVLPMTKEQLEEQMEKMSESEVFGHDVAILLWVYNEASEQVEEKEILLAKKEQKKEEKTEVVYIGLNEVLTILYDGEERKVALPHSALDGFGDLIEVKVAEKEKKMKLQMKWIQEPAKTYEVEL